MIKYTLRKNRDFGINLGEGEWEGTYMRITTYTDPDFYFVTERLNYVIRGEIWLEEKIDEKILQHAVDTAFNRFPYFSIQLVIDDNRYVVIPNYKPHIIVNTDKPVVLNSPEVNYHLFVITYFENKIFFNVSHCITDGIGRAPFTRTVLYYYLTEKYGLKLDSDGIYLADQGLFDDEDGDPVPIEEVMQAESDAYRSVGDAFKLRSLDAVKDDVQKKFIFSVDETEFIKFCKEHKATPNSMTTALLSKVTWQLGGSIDKNLVTNICVNMRPGLNNKHSHHFLLNCIPIIYTPEMRNDSLDNLNALARQFINEQTTTTNLKYLCKMTVNLFLRIKKMKKLELKKNYVRMAMHGRDGFLASTYIISYVGKNSLGSLYPYVKAEFTIVDAMPDDGIIVEITSADGKFFFSFMQDFSSDVIVNSFIDELEKNNIPVQKIDEGPLGTPTLLLPVE